MFDELHEAASRGDVAAVAVLLDRDADVNSEDMDGDRPLHKAAAAGHVEVVCLLLDRGADVEARDALNALL